MFNKLKTVQGIKSTAANIKLNEQLEDEVVFGGLLEEISDLMSGGVADMSSIEDIAKKHGIEVEKIKSQIEIGTDVEKEHVGDDIVKAREIAMDHLFEIPDYYDRLKKMESQAHEEHKSAPAPQPEASPTIEMPTLEQVNPSLRWVRKLILKEMSVSGIAGPDATSKGPLVWGDKGPGVMVTSPHGKVEGSKDETKKTAISAGKLDTKGMDNNMVADFRKLRQSEDVEPAVISEQDQFAKPTKDESALAPAMYLPEDGVEEESLDDKFITHSTEIFTESYYKRYQNTLKKENLPSNPEYGVPEENKFPLFDKKHVIAAIRSFNYVKSEHEKNLARRIIAKMKEHGLRKSSVGEENKLRPYIEKSKLSE